MRRLVIGCALFVAALGTAGCLTPAQRREDTLSREVHLANDDLRWGRYEQFVAYLPPDEAQLFMRRVRDIEDDLMMADFEVIDLSFGSSNETAISQLKLSWYTKRQGTVRHARIEQQWEHKNGRWMIAKQRRTRGDRFPLIVEPASAPPATPAVTGADRSPTPPAP